MSFSSSILRVDKQSDNPLDSVQTIIWDHYDRNSRTFLTGGWDGIIRMYQIEGHTTKRIEKKIQFFFYHPIITMDITSQRLVIVGLATGQIGAVDLKNFNNVAMLGSHDSTICKVIWLEKFEILLSFGFDNLIKVFSLKNGQNGNYQTNQYKLPHKTTTVAYSQPYLLIGTQEGRIALLHSQRLNTTNFQNQYQYIFDECHGIVKFSCSALHSNRGRMIFGVADGRIVSTTFTDGSSGIRVSKPTVTRYQKRSNYRKQTCGMMNCVDIGLKQGKYQFVLYCGTIQTGIYSTQKNMKIKTISTSQSSVTCISISPDCQYYVYCFGSDWCKGLDQLGTYNQVKIYVGRLSTNEVSSGVGMGTSSYLR